MEQTDPTETQPSSHSSAPPADVKTVDVVYERPWLYPLQEHAIFYPRDANGDLARFSLIEAATKTGKTVGCIAWLFEQALFGKDGNNYWWIAPVYGQAEIAFRRMKKAYPEGTFTANEGNLTLRLNLVGTVIWFKSAEKPDNLYGEDVYAAVIDEASRMREESWHAIRSTITATRGPVRFIGNVKGRKNWFYAMARKAESGEPGMAYFKIIASDAVAAGVLATAEIEEARRDLPEQVFRELYLAEPSDDGGNPFGLKAIADCVGPLSNQAPKVWGFDLAKHIDWTVGVALDKDNRVCRFERFQKPWDDTIAYVTKLAGSTPALVDSTGVGDPILEMLQKKIGTRFEGYNFSGPSKQKLMEGLAVAIQSQTITLPDGIMRRELEDFEYEYTRTGVRYCVEPSTPVLTANLHWLAAGSLLEGDKLIGFDEEPLEENKCRRWKQSIVTDTKLILRPCYRVILKDGTEFVCSAEHLWLVANGNGPIEWKKTSELRGEHKWSSSPRYAPHKLLKVVDTWKEEHSYEAGYLAAAFDGEGCLTQIERLDHNGCVSRLSFAQRDNAMAAHMRHCLSFFGFEWSENGGSGTNKDVLTFSLKGRTANLMRLLGQIRPKRLLSNFDSNKLGTMWTDEKVSIEAVEYLGDREVVAMGTTTKTFIASGFATHNSAPEGFHDDCVCALSLAVMHAGHAIPALHIPSKVLDWSARR